MREGRKEEEGRANERTHTKHLLFATLPLVRACLAPLPRGSQGVELLSEARVLSAAMEPKHKELLAQCHQSLAQAMTEVDKVIDLLEAAGTLSPRDLHELQEAGIITGAGEEGDGGGGDGGGRERASASVCRADLLIKLLLAKDRDHFQDLRVALEKTQPHLLSILYLNNGVAGTQPGETAGEWKILGVFAWELAGHRLIIGGGEW